MANSSRRNFIKNTSLSVAGSVAGINYLSDNYIPDLVSSKATAKLPRSKRDLVMDVLNMAKTPSYVPAGFFMHFGVKGDTAVKAHTEYFRATGMDFVKIQFDEQGLPENKEIKTPEDWAKIPILSEKWFEPSLYLLKNLIKELKSEALIIQTLYSPYQMAKQAVPWETLVRHVGQTQNL
ncbi:MAG: hypothetical protein IPN68_12545 [Bacteroidetes bacterium]|nr:hypothetical protein [Bacteroidota bacterium]